MIADRILRDVAHLAARITLGGSIAAHGAQKLFGAFGGPGLDGAGKYFESLGFADGKSMARTASLVEISSGALIALGALGPVGPALLTSTMVVAAETVHRPKGYFTSNGGFELNAMYTLGALLLANNGYGNLSIDGLTGLEKRSGPVLGWLAIAGGIAGAAYILSQRTPPKPHEHTIKVERGSTQPTTA